MKTKINITFISVLILLLGCDIVGSLDERPPHLIATETLFVNLDGFETGLNGLYALVRQEREGESTGSEGGSNQLRYEITVTGTDAVVANRLDRFSLVSANWGNLNNAQNPHIESHFIWLYRTINAANTIINNAETRDDVDWTGGGATPEENKNRILAEARALRAWAYRHLTYMWGDVPLNLQEALGTNIRTDWVRTPVREVREQIIEDLLFAEEHLDVEPRIRGKITKGAVQHYLAEMYLALDGVYPPSNQNATQALHWANEVVNEPAYQLVTSRYGVDANEPGVAFMDMFLDGNSNREEGNTEALWVWQWHYGISGGGRNIMRRWLGSEYQQIQVGGIYPLSITTERGGRPQARSSMTKWAIDLYEPEDDRGSHHAIRKFFILKDEVQNDPWPADVLPEGYAYGDTIWLNWEEDITWDPDFVPYRDWPYPRKWDHTDPGNATEVRSNKDGAYLRLAETYLLKAEAEYLLGRTGDAAQSINEVRRRSNASDISAGDVTLDFILDERSRELIYEEHRRYTLLRTGTWLDRTRAFNNNGGQFIESRDILYPIPQVVIDANITGHMPQNDGY